jgi:hypothetical protein
MYAWVWRKLPYRAPGKIAGVLVALAGIVGLLWFGAFPIVDRHLPNNNVQVTQPGGSVSAPPTPADTPSQRPPTSALPPSALPR